MKIELTRQQLLKFKHLSEEGWDKLKAVLEEGGTVEWTDDLEELRRLSIVKKIGPSAMFSFLIDGTKRVLSSGLTGKKRSGTMLQQFMYCAARLLEQGRFEANEIGILKKCTEEMTLEEFDVSLRDFVDKDVDGTGLTILKFWRAHKYQKTDDLSRFDR